MVSWYIYLVGGPAVSLMYSVLEGYDLIGHGILPSLDDLYLYHSTLASPCHPFLARGSNNLSLGRS